MKHCIIFYIFLAIPFLGCSQQNKKHEIEIQEHKIAEAVSELKKTTSVNYMKHVNQVEGLKDGIWIESTNGYLWFINYNMGLKQGDLNVYYCGGKKYLEATYKNGFLVDKMTFFDTKGDTLEIYENINLNDSIVIKDNEKAEGGSIYFTKDPHRYQYSAEIKRFTSEGEVYAIGVGLFDDDWLFGCYKVGVWSDPRDGK